MTQRARSPARSAARTIRARPRRTSASKLVRCCHAAWLAAGHDAHSAATQRKRAVRHHRMYGAGLLHWDQWRGQIRSGPFGSPSSALCIGVSAVAVVPPASAAVAALPRQSTKLIEADGAGAGVLLSLLAMNCPPVMLRAWGGDPSALEAVVGGRARWSPRTRAPVSSRSRRPGQRDKRRCWPEDGGWFTGGTSVRLQG